MLSAVQLATSVDDAWWEWFRLFSEAIDNNVPKYVVKDSWGLAWVNKELGSIKEASSGQIKYHHRAKLTNNTADWANDRKKETKSMCRSEHKLFIQDLGETSKHNPKGFWSPLPPEIFHNGTKFSGSDDQAGGFNKFFHSVFGKPTNTTINSDVADPHPDLSLVTVTVD